VEVRFSLASRTSFAMPLLSGLREESIVPSSTARSLVDYVRQFLFFDR